MPPRRTKGNQENKPMEINEKVRSLREINQLSQEEMAAKLGMSTNGYAKIERGERRLDIPKLEQIAQVFGIDAVELMQFDDKQTVMINGKIQLGKKSVLYQASGGCTYYSTHEQAAHEIETLKLTLAHKEEMLQQKEQENALLKELVAALKAAP